MDHETSRGPFQPHQFCVCKKNQTKSLKTKQNRKTAVKKKNEEEYLDVISNPWKQHLPTPQEHQHILILYLHV